MSKILVVADNHGSAIPLTIVRENFERFDKVIFLGDFFDHEEKEYDEQKLNFKKVMKLKKENPEKVIVLIGNHDANYILPEMRCWQPEHEDEIRNMISKNLNLIDFVFVDGKWLFTHAGISSLWFQNTVDALNQKYENLKLQKRFSVDVVKRFNDLFHQSEFLHLRFTGYSGYGDEVTQNPLWIRPASLLKCPVNGFNQVVGHTPVTDEERCRKNGDDILLFLDSDWRNVYAEIDTETSQFEILEYENPCAEW